MLSKKREGNERIYHAPFMTLSSDIECSDRLEQFCLDDSFGNIMMRWIRLDFSFRVSES